jgi:hypothetical protein
MPRDEFGVTIEEGTRVAFQLGTASVTGVVTEIEEGSIMGTLVQPGKMSIMVSSFIAWDPRQPDKIRGVYVTQAQPEPDIPPAIQTPGSAITQ